MRAVIQRVSSSSVSVDGQEIGAIGPGITLFLGIKEDDTLQDCEYILNKTIHLRIFEDENGKMNLSLLDVGGELLVISQFTLYGDCRKGRRPGFSRGGSVEDAEKLYDQFVRMVQESPVKKIATGEFQAEMQVTIHNDGPVTLLLDSEKVF